MGSIQPDMDDLRAFLQAEGDPQHGDRPIMMLNLLRFRDRAEYAADFEAEPCSGREAYGRYMAVAAEKVAAVGGRRIWKGTVLTSLIGPASERWDEAFVIEYPSRAAFARMLADPTYQAVVPHRTAALADSRLIATGQ